MFDTQSSQSLSAEIQFLRSILYNLTEGVVVADEAGRFVFFNRVAQDILGMGAVDAPSDEWPAYYGCYKPDRVTLIPSHELPLARAVAGEDVPETEIYIRNRQRPEGVWIRVRGNPLRDDVGRIQGGVVVFRDVTRRKLADAELQKLTNAVEQIADTILITDKNGIIEYVNPACVQITGYSREELVGRTPRLLKSGLHDPQFYTNMWTTLLEGKPFRATITNRKKSGGTYYAEQTITPIRDPGGAITHFVSILKDVTEQRKSQEREFHMSLARTVQQRFYNVAVPRIEGFDIAGSSIPADATGGDYFDFVPLASGDLGIAIGDVCGHGISAALLMTELRAYLKAFALETPDTGALMTRMNSALSEDLQPGQFVTLAFCRLSAAQRSLVYTSAGHMPAFLLNSDGTLNRILESTDVPLGIFPDLAYNRSKDIPLAPGAILLLVTDGIAEAEDPDDLPFGTERALEYIRSHRAASAAEIVAGLCQAVREFSHGSSHRDDVTAIVCKAIG